MHVEERPSRRNCVRFSCRSGGERSMRAPRCSPAPMSSGQGSPPVAERRLLTGDHQSAIATRPSLARATRDERHAKKFVAAAEKSLQVHV
jgi:hypothetical protein